MKQNIGIELTFTLNNTLNHKNMKQEIGIELTFTLETTIQN